MNKLYDIDGRLFNAKPFVRSERKISRNEPCPCGSGKKFKKCHLNGEPTKSSMTKVKALKALEAGERLTHKWFTREEWIEEWHGMYLFEDGCKCNPKEFWEYRNDESWEDEWRIY